MPIGNHWGSSAFFSVSSGDLGIDHNNNTKRNVHLQSVQGSFDVHCKVCGLTSPFLVDTDIREGHVEVSFEFGPNTHNGVIDESDIEGYSIFLVSACHEKLSGELQFVNKTESPMNHLQDTMGEICLCPTWVYQTTVTAQLPSSHLIDGLPNGADVRIMIAPKLQGGYVLPFGVTTSVLEDYYTTTTTTTSTVSSTTTSSTSTSATTTTTTTSTITSTTTTSTTTTGTATTSTTSTTITSTISSTTSTSSVTSTSTQTVTKPTLNETEMDETTQSSLTQEVVQVKGSMGLSVSPPEAAAQMVNDPKAKEAVSESIAQHTGVDKEQVEVTLSLGGNAGGNSSGSNSSGSNSSAGNATNSSAGVSTGNNSRRLDTWNVAVYPEERRLQSTNVLVEYVISLPSNGGEDTPEVAEVVNAIADPQAAGSMSTLITEKVAEKVGEGVYSVAVTEVATPTVETITVTITTTSTAAATNGTESDATDDEGGSSAGVAVAGTLGALAVAGGGGYAAHRYRKRKQDHAVHPLPEEPPAAQGAYLDEAAAGPRDAAQGAYEVAQPQVDIRNQISASVRAMQ